MVKFGDNWACSCCRGAHSLSAADSADPVTGLTSSSLDCVRTSTSSSFTSRASRPNLCRSSWFSVNNPCDFSRKSSFSIRSFSFSISRSNTCCSSSLILAFFLSRAVWAATRFFNFLLSAFSSGVRCVSRCLFLGGTSLSGDSGLDGLWMGNMTDVRDVQSLCSC